MFLINCSLVLFWVFTGVNLGQSIADQAGGSWANLTGRPLGLFMSAHVSAYFSAIFLIYHLHRINSYGLGLLLIWSTTSLFNLIAYSAQIIVTFLARHIWLMFYAILICFAVISVMGLIMSLNSEADMLETLMEPLSNFFSPDRLMGVGVIFDQVFNLEVYSRVITIFPSDYRSLLENWTDAFGNELMLFTYIQHAGLLLLIFYLWVLGPKIRFFLIFALVGLLHYGDITSPLFIYMMISYSMLLQNQEKSLSAYPKKGKSPKLTAISA